MRQAIAYDVTEKIGDKTIVHQVAYTQVSGDEAREIILRHFPSGRDVVRERILAEMDRNEFSTPRAQYGERVAEGGPRETPREAPKRGRWPDMTSGNPGGAMPAPGSGVRQTSRAAYSKAKIDGKLTAQQAVVMAAFDGQGHTRQELAARTGLGINCVCGRIDELIKAGVVRETEKRLCRITKQNAMELEAVV